MTAEGDGCHHSKPLSNIFTRLGQHRGVSEAWTKANVISTLKKWKKEDPGNCQSLLSIWAGDKTILKAFSKHRKNKKVTGYSQHRFMGGKHA